MAQNNNTKNNSKTKIIVISAIVAVVAAAVVLGIILSRNNYLATTMRLLKVEGTVNLEDSKGGSKPVVDNLRFKSGDALNTGSDGLASIGLDDTKIVTLDNDSRAEFKKKKKQLELKLTKGALFFNVTEKLKADEKFEIKTSTMTAGIRGTIGVVYYHPKTKLETLAVAEGSVAASATNPVTNETKSILVEAGQEICVYLYNDRKENSVEFVLRPISEADISEFARSMIVSDDSITSRVLGSNPSWTKDNLKAPKPPVDKASDPPKTEEPATNPPADPPAEPSTDPKEDPPAEEPVTPPSTPKKKIKKKNKKKVVKKVVKKTTKKKKSSGLTPPKGYAKTSIWGKSFRGSKVYIAKKKKSGNSDAPEFKGYSNKKWIALFAEPGVIEDDGVYTIYYTDGEKEYYKQKTGNAIATTT